MTANSPESMERSNDTINVLPILSEAKAPVSLTLTIDKSVSKVAAWVIVAFGMGMTLIGAACVLGVWMITSYNRQEREARMVEYYQHELDAKLIAAGFLKPSQTFDNFKNQQEQKK